MGVVYAAVDPLIAHNLAIKVIHGEALADDNEAEFMRERLFRESSLPPGNCFTPGIVTVLDVGAGGRARVYRDGARGRPFAARDSEAGPEAAS